MKKILLSITLISLFALPVVSLAAIETIPPGPTSIDQFIAMIDTVSNWAFAVLLAVAVVYIILSAYKFLTSGGDPGRVGEARMALLYALVGVGVAFIAKGLVYLVRVVLGIA